MTFSFDGIIKDFIRIYRSESRAMAAPRNHMERAVAGRAGAVKGRTQVLPRILTIPVTIFYDNLNDLPRLKEELAAWLVTDVSGELIFPDEPDRCYRAVFSTGLDNLTENPRTASGVLTFTCFDPFKYATQAKRVALGGSSGVIENQGSVATLPVVRVRFTDEVNNFEVSNETLGKSCRVNWNFQSGDILELDMEHEAVRINGRLRLASWSWSDSDFFELARGENLLQWMHSGNVALEVLFTERWL